MDMPDAFNWAFTINDSGINAGRRIPFGMVTYKDMLESIRMKERQITGYPKRVKLDKEIAAKRKAHPKEK
jgi:hypothetical protein